MTLVAISSKMTHHQIEGREQYEAEVQPRRQKEHCSKWTSSPTRGVRSEEESYCVLHQINLSMLVVVYR